MSSDIDPKGLIDDAYEMQDLTLPECRSIFLDWALSLPEGIDQADALNQIFRQFAADRPAHPMTEVITEGLHVTDKPTRRGGWRARR